MREQKLKEKEEKKEEDILKIIPKKTNTQEIYAENKEKTPTKNPNIQPKQKPPRPKQRPREKESPPFQQPIQQSKEKVREIKYEELSEHQKKVFEKIKEIVENLKEGEETFIDAKTLKELGKIGIKYLEQYLENRKYYFKYFGVIRTIDGEYIPTEELGLYIYKQRPEEEDEETRGKNIT